MWSIFFRYRDTEGGQCQLGQACHPQWFFYVPLTVSKTAPPFTWSCEPWEIHSLQCWREGNKSPQASPAHDRDWTRGATAWQARMLSLHYCSLLWSDMKCIKILYNIALYEYTQYITYTVHVPKLDIQHIATSIHVAFIWLAVGSLVCLYMYMCGA